MYEVPVETLVDISRTYTSEFDELPPDLAEQLKKTEDGLSANHKNPRQTSDYKKHLSELAKKSQVRKLLEAIEEDPTVVPNMAHHMLEIYRAFMQTARIREDS